MNTVHAPIIIEADINVEQETQMLKEKAAKVLNLPEESDRQMDLMYFTAVYVSSGMNLNNAFFDSEELLKAEHTIVNKALDLEHKEKDIVGHIYDRAFIDESGKLYDLDMLKKDPSKIKGSNMHIIIAGIIYKDRFPEVAQEVLDNKWKVSMETFYSDFDLKIGDLIITRNEAKSLGYSDSKLIVGKKAKVMKSGKEIGSGVVGRVLRGIHFSGCGLVENPANPASFILEVADKSEDTQIVLDDDNNLTSISLETSELNDIDVNAVGICVNYKRRLLDKSNKIDKEDWCAKYNTTCTSVDRTAKDLSCLIHKVTAETNKAITKALSSKRINDSLHKLNSILKIN